MLIKDINLLLSLCNSYAFKIQKHELYINSVLISRDGQISPRIHKYDLNQLAT
jgi:hypothetical protein